MSAAFCRVKECEYRIKYSTSLKLGRRRMLGLFRSVGRILLGFAVVELAVGALDLLGGRRSRGGPSP